VGRAAPSAGVADRPSGCRLPAQPPPLQAAAS